LVVEYVDRKGMRDVSKETLFQESHMWKKIYFHSAIIILMLVSVSIYWSVWNQMIR